MPAKPMTANQKTAAIKAALNAKVKGNPILAGLLKLLLPILLEVLSEFFAKESE